MVSGSNRGVLETTHRHGAAQPSKVLPRISAAIEQSASSEDPIIKKTRPKRVLRYENHIKNYSILIEKIFWQIIKENLNFRFDISENLINCVILISAKFKIH